MTTPAPGAPRRMHLAKHRLASSVCAALLCSILAMGGAPTVFAQETPESGIETVESVTATEAPVEEITEVPAEDYPTEEITEAPVEEIVTDEPTDEPVLEPTLEPTLEVTDEPTLEATDPPTEEATVTDEPTATVEPTVTEVPTETPSPTATATPSPVPPTLSCLSPDGLAIVDAISVVIGQRTTLHCTVTVNDRLAPAAVAIVSSDPAWTGAPDQPVVFEDANLATATSYPLDITLTAPRAPGSTTELALTLTLAGTSEPLAIVRIPLVSIIDPAWTLHCSADVAVVGASAPVQCEIPDAAWAVRGDSPLLTYATAGAWASGNGVALDSATFTITMPLPCTVTSTSDTITVAVILGEGLAFTTSIDLSIDQVSGRSLPSVSAVQTTSGQSTWTGSAWTTAEIDVTMTITAPETGCAVQEWSVQSSMTPLATSTDIIPDAITFTGATQSTDGLTAGMPAVVTLGGGVTVVSGSGTGTGTITLTFAVTPNPTTPAGDYTGTFTYTTTAAGPVMTHSGVSKDGSLADRASGMGGAYASGEGRVGRTTEGG